MITAIIPALNEQNLIEEAIASESFADEVIVIDSFSTDKTVELAEKFPIKIVKRRFDDFSSQKNTAIDQTYKVMRLFNKKHCRYNGNLVHELIDYDGKVRLKKNRLKNYS